MARIAYVNGSYVNLSARAIGIEDRGYQFADGVYEVIKAIDGELLDMDRHTARLERSLQELAIPMPMSAAALRLVIEEVLRRNRARHAAVYVQVSRGSAPRNHVWGNGRLRPSVVVTARPARFPSAQELEKGVKVISLPDERWAHCHIKSVSLLPNVLAKQKAAQAGAREAWLIGADGMVTEGSSSNAYIVTQDGTLVTTPLGHAILGGITRSVILELAREKGYRVEERAFSLEEAQAAREAFMTSTTSLVLPVTEIDGRPVANGMPGQICRDLLSAYARHCHLEYLFDLNT